MFDLGPVLLLVEIDPILKEQGCKIHALLTFNSSSFQIIFTLLIELFAFYGQVSIV